MTRYVTTEATLDDYIDNEHLPITHEEVGTVVHRWKGQYKSVCGAPTEWVKSLPDSEDVFCYECWHGEWATEQELPTTEPVGNFGTIDYNKWMARVLAESSPIRKVQ